MARKKSTPAKKHAAATTTTGEPKVMPLGSFPEGAWVEVKVLDEWRLARIRFFIWGEPYVRFNDEGAERVGMRGDTPARAASPPGGVSSAAPLNSNEDVDPLLR